MSDDQRFVLPAQSTFVLSRWVRFAGVVLAPALAVLFALGGREIIRDPGSSEPWQLALGLALVGALALAMLCAPFLILRARLTVDREGMAVRGVFGTRRIPWGRIEGFRLSAGRLFVVPQEDRWPLNLSHYANRGLLLAWLVAHLPDLQEADLAKEAKEILADHSLGWIGKDKTARLAELKRIVRPVNWAGYVAAAAGGLNALFLDDDRVQEVAAWALILVAVALFLLALRFRDQVRLDYKEGSLYPEGGSGLLACGIGIGLISLLDHHNVLGERFGQWTAALTAAAAWLWLSLEWRRIREQRRWMIAGLHVAGIVFVSGFWAGGTLYQINKSADKSEAVWGTTRVTKLRKSQERTGTSYHATVAPWSASSEPLELDVSRETYETLAVGAAVDISVRRGALEIPWVEQVRAKQPGASRTN